MPVETRTLLFDQEELKKAVHDHLLDRQSAERTDRLLDIEVRSETDGVAVVHVVASGGAATQTEMTYAEVMEALIRFCRRHEIPLPRYGDKRLTRAGNGVALMVRMVFSHPLDEA